MLGSRNAAKLSSVVARSTSASSIRAFSTASVDDPAFVKEGIQQSGEWMGCKRSFMAPLQISSRGVQILHNPLFNKGTAFKYGERDRLRIRGLLPSRIMNIHKQKERFLIALRAEESNIRKNILLEDLHDRNETLYHRVLVDHIEEMAPIIYTPTVGQACMEFGARFRRPRGMYFSEEDRGNMAVSMRLSVASENSSLKRLFRSFDSHFFKTCLFRAGYGIQLAAYRCKYKVGQIHQASKSKYLRIFRCICTHDKSFCLEQVHVIVVTDGSRILGLGDLGANGMGTFTFIYINPAVERTKRPTHILQRNLFLTVHRYSGWKAIALLRGGWHCAASSFANRVGRGYEQ
jgi:hypothetical protein